MNKTKVVNFKDDDFDFLGFHFNHWRTSMKGKDYYYITPADKSIKSFKKSIKDKTQRKWTKSKEEWIKDVNPIIIGKTNYYLNVFKAVQVFEKHGTETHCNVKILGHRLHNVDTYIRQRLRMCMIHKHPTIRKAIGMRYKWNIEFFVSIGLIPSKWWYFDKMYGYPISKYVENEVNRGKRNMEKILEKYKKQGKVYYTKRRLEKMDYSFSR